MKKHFLFVLENGTVHVLRHILMFLVILLLVFFQKQYSKMP